MEKMIELLSNKYFQFLVIPLLTIFLAVFVKYVSKKDEYSRLRKEDFAIGLEISIAAIVLLISNTLKYMSSISLSNGVQLMDSNNLLVLPWVILFIVVGLWGISTLIRKKGWKNEDEMTWLCGIILPNIFGLSVLILVVNWISG